jgi:hypothetical protein
MQDVGCGGQGKHSASNPASGIRHPESFYLDFADYAADTSRIDLAARLVFFSCACGELRS